MTINKNDKALNQLLMHSATKNNVPYASIDTPNGQFRIYSEMEEGYNGCYITFVKDGQTVEQDICMAEIDPNNPKGFSVKVWSDPLLEEYREDIRFGQYIEPQCPYCGNYGVKVVDIFRNEIKFFLR